MTSSWNTSDSDYEDGAYPGCKTCQSKSPVHHVSQIASPRLRDGDYYAQLSPNLSGEMGAAVTSVPATGARKSPMTHRMNTAADAYNQQKHTSQTNNSKKLFGGRQKQDGPAAQIQHHENQDKQQAQRHGQYGQHRHQNNRDQKARREGRQPGQYKHQVLLNNPGQRLGKLQQQGQYQNPQQGQYQNPQQGQYQNPQQGQYQNPQQGQQRGKSYSLTQHDQHAPYLPSSKLTGELHGAHDRFTTAKENAQPSLQLQRSSHHGSRTTVYPTNGRVQIMSGPESSDDMYDQEFTSNESDEEGYYSDESDEDEGTKTVQSPFTRDIAQIFTPATTRTGKSNHRQGHYLDDNSVHQQWTDLTMDMTDPQKEKIALVKQRITESFRTAKGSSDSLVEETGVEGCMFAIIEEGIVICHEIEQSSKGKMAHIVDAKAQVNALAESVSCLFWVMWLHNAEMYVDSALKNPIISGMDDLLLDTADPDAMHNVGHARTQMVNDQQPQTNRAIALQNLTPDAVNEGMSHMWMMTRMMCKDHIDPNDSDYFGTESLRTMSTMMGVLTEVLTAVSGHLHDNNSDIGTDIYKSFVNFIGLSMNRVTELMCYGGHNSITAHD
jgi:hypothetical protein